MVGHSVVRLTSRRSTRFQITGIRRGSHWASSKEKGKGTTVLNKEPRPQQGLSSGKTHPPELSPAGLISTSLAWGKTVTIHSPSSHPIPPKKGGALDTLVKLKPAGTSFQRLSPCRRTDTCLPVPPHLMPIHSSSFYSGYHVWLSKK